MPRLANSLVKLRDQVNAAYPNRSRASDGWLGDAAHAARASDHNPNPQGVVCALDLTHDPTNGFDGHALADQLRINRHPNLKYIISNSRIADGQNNWVWRKFTGSNPHTKHIHISVGFGPDGRSAAGSYDNETPWKINEKGGDMPLTPTQLDKLIKMAKMAEPSVEELNNATYQRDPGLAIDTMWNTWGKDRYANRQNSSVASQKQLAAERAINAVKDALSL